MKKFASILLSMLMATGAIAAASAETYTGTAQGIGEVSVTLTVEDGKITAAEVVGESETKGIGYEPCADGTFADAIVAAQGVDFDSISGATVTSNAVKDAAKKAMAAAGLIEAEDTTVTDTECDVVIVGAGGAGMTAALQAVDSGVNSVIIVEKGGSTGGNTSRATGGMNAAKTVYQDENEWSDATTTAVEKAIATAEEKYADGDKISNLTATVKEQFEAYKANPEGYFDSVELFALDTIIGGKGLNNFDLVMTLTGNSAEAIDWLATKNAHLTNVGSFGGASVKRIHRATTEDGKTTPVGAYLVKVLTADVEAEDKIDLRTNTAATEIVMEDGKAVGVKVKSENGEYTIRAKAVILASGGFGADLDRVAALKPALAGFVTTNVSTVTGDGIDMAVAVGAATVDMNQIQIHPSVYTETTTALITEGIRGDGAILVNQEGKRFVEELGRRDVLSEAILDQTGGYCWVLWNDKIGAVSNTVKEHPTEYDAFTKQGIMTTCPDLKCIADFTKIPYDSLKGTVDRVTSMAGKGNDKDFHHRAGLVDMSQGQYYVIKAVPSVHHTMGGVRINEKAQALTADGKLIPGLWAAGEVTGVTHGTNRLGGNAYTDIIVFGRIAGKAAAEAAK